MTGPETGVTLPGESFDSNEQTKYEELLKEARAERGDPLSDAGDYSGGKGRTDDEVYDESRAHGAKPHIEAGLSDEERAAANRVKAERPFGAHYGTDARRRTEDAAHHFGRARDAATEAGEAYDDVQTAPERAMKVLDDASSQTRQSNRP